MHRVIGAGVTVVALMAGAAATSAQQVLDLSGDGHFCSFAHDDVMPEQLYSFSSSAQAEDLVAEIMSTVGLVPRFRIQAANVPNAAAVIQGDERLIVYSEDWIQHMIADNKWAAVALMGHEIAHHLNGHTLQDGGSRPLIELESDKFAGFAVGKLGGSLSDAQWLFRQFSEEGSSTHPPRQARLEAVAVGWRDATGGGTLTTRSDPQPAPQPAPGHDRIAGDWFVVMGSFPHDAAAQARARLTELRDRGLPAVVVDTDDFANLRDGLYTVVVATNSRDSAFDALDVVQRHVPDAYVKKGN